MSSTAIVVPMFAEAGLDALRTLQTAGVVVILRPFHECNGEWFWWGTKFLLTTQIQSLWKFTNTYLT